MTQAAKTQEPSMEEILASIRRIIADDDATKSAKPAEPAAAAPAASAPSPPPPAPAAASAPQPAPPPAAAAPSRPAAPPPAAVASPAPPPPPAAVAPPALPPPPAAVAPPAPSAAKPSANNQQQINAMVADLDAPPKIAAAMVEPPPAVAPPMPPPPTPVAPAADVFDLTEAMAAAPTPSVPPPAPAPPPAPNARTIDATSDVVFAERAAEPARPSPDGLMSGATRAAVDSAFHSLANTVLGNNARTLEDLVKEMLRPMLKGWLDDNLPGMVERIVRAEIERVSRGR